MGRLELTVTGIHGEPQRLDRWCAGCELPFTRSAFKQLVTAVLVNGRPVKLSRLVQNGDTVVLDWKDPPAASVEPQNIPLSILYENELVTVINKRQGMVTHPGSGNHDGTAVNALLFHWGKTVQDETGFRAGIVHRLDKDTSGVMITARDYQSELWLQNEFKERRVGKYYIAILCGKLPGATGKITARIARDPGNRKRFKVTERTDIGKTAVTFWKVLSVRGLYSLVAFKLGTGRTHQLRVHSRYMGCPILGDPIYGKRDALFPDATLMLHARLLLVRLPGAKERSRFKAPVPGRFRRILQTLDRAYGKS